LLLFFRPLTMLKRRRKNSFYTGTSSFTVKWMFCV
jgi:hypothetical protein